MLRDSLEKVTILKTRGHFGYPAVKMWWDVIHLFVQVFMFPSSGTRKPFERTNAGRMRYSAIFPLMFLMNFWFFGLSHTYIYIYIYSGVSINFLMFHLKIMGQKELTKTCHATRGPWPGTGGSLWTFTFGRIGWCWQPVGGKLASNPSVERCVTGWWFQMVLE